MKKVMAVLALMIGLVSVASAEYVNGYLRKDGTYVNGYYRTPRNDSPYDNQSMPGNYNFNTGRVTTGNQSEYLSDYYQKKSNSSFDSFDETPKRRSSNSDTYFGFGD